MTRDPDSPVTAYCAPGLAGYAERLLDTSGEIYREVIEHPGMAGRTDVILAADPVFPLPPFDTPLAGPGPRRASRPPRRPRPGEDLRGPAPLLPAADRHHDPRPRLHLPRAAAMTAAGQDLRDVLRGLRCVQAGWAFGVPEDGREQWLDLVCAAVTA